MAKAKATKLVQKRSLSGRAKSAGPSGTTQEISGNSYSRALVTKENYDQNKEPLDLYPDTQQPSSQFDNVVTTMIVEVTV